MHRTTIMLPNDLKLLALRHAQTLGVSFGQLVRESLEKRIKTAPSKKSDTFWADTAVFKGPTPKNLSKEHDQYLYEEGL